MLFTTSLVKFAFLLPFFGAAYAAPIGGISNVAAVPNTVADTVGSSAFGVGYAAATVADTVAHVPTSLVGNVLEGLVNEPRDEDALLTASVNADAHLDAVHANVAANANAKDTIHSFKLLGPSVVSDTNVAASVADNAAASVASPVVSLRKGKGLVNVKLDNHDVVLIRDDVEAGHVKRVCVLGICLPAVVPV